MYNTTKRGTWGASYCDGRAEVRIERIKNGTIYDGMLQVVTITCNSGEADLFRLGKIVTKFLNKHTT